MLKRLIALTTVVCLAAGCAPWRASHLRVVDADTGQPIHGVDVNRRSIHWQPGAPGILPVPFPSSQESLTSDVSGTVSFENSGESFALRKEGYEAKIVRTTWLGFQDEDWLIPMIHPLSFDGSLQVPLERSEEE